MPGFLHEVTLHKQKEIASRRALIADASLERKALPASGRFRQCLSGEGLKLITEIKPSSPSAGTLRQTVDLKAILPAYDEYASAISVLTDSKYFGGSLELLGQVARGSRLPVLCKDFVLDDYQILEARAAGAEAVLLIVKMLGDNLLTRLHDFITKLGMTPVVEVQNESETSRALKLSPQVILINNRDLDSFAIDLKTTARLAPLVPDNIIKVAASGIATRQDLESLLPYCSRFLIGSSLMQADDISAKLKELSQL